MSGEILWVEGKRGGNLSFVPSLRNKGYQVNTVSTGKAAIMYLSETKPDVAVVNAPSLRSSGKRICYSLRSVNGRMPILLITNPEHPVVKDIGANVVLDLPFTVRKLVNRLDKLLPGESNHLFRVGEICLDIERKQVHLEDREAQLTPRLTRLLQTLMRKPGVVFDREELFREVWKTNYVGDTRTLDVHISWLRDALKESPRNPMFLKTIRGVGYRLDV